MPMYVLKIYQRVSSVRTRNVCIEYKTSDVVLQKTVQKKINCRSGQQADVEMQTRRKGKEAHFVCKDDKADERPPIS